MLPPKPPLQTDGIVGELKGSRKRVLPADDIRNWTRPRSNQPPTVFFSSIFFNT